MTESPIKTRREGPILEVTLDRPKARAAWLGFLSEAWGVDIGGTPQ